MTAALALALEPCPHRTKLASMNISYAADLWLGTLTAKGHSDRTVDKYRRLLYKLSDEHPRHIDIETISIVDLRGFLERQSKRRNRTRKAPATIAQDVSTLCQFFDWLTREGVVKRNPTRRNGDRIIDRPKLLAADENDNVKTISGDGVRALLEHANRGDWSERLAVNTLVYSGARRHAVAQLRIGDYDPVGRMLTFTEKGGKTIDKPVPHELARLLDAAIAAGVYETADDYLIPARAQQRRDGDRDDRIIWRIVRDVAARAGVDTHVHALRAAFAVHYLETHPGHSVALQKLMGHKRPETTQVYLRRLDRRQAMETVRDLSWQPNKGDDDGRERESLHGRREQHSGRGQAAAAGVVGGDHGRRDGEDRSRDRQVEIAVGSGSPQIAGELFEALPLTEKEEGTNGERPIRGTESEGVVRGRAGVGPHPELSGAVGDPGDQRDPGVVQHAAAEDGRHVAGLPVSPAGVAQIASELFESLPLTEKEGFEPSLQANPQKQTVGTESGDPAPVIDLMARLRARAREGA